MVQIGANVSVELLCVREGKQAGHPLCVFQVARLAFGAHLVTV